MSEPSVGTYWKHVRRGCVAVVLCIDGDQITFQFPRARNNPARGTTHWPRARFLTDFTPVPEAKP
jgi:hypothetical protein